ncbi:MAG: hypothetical protein L6Q38_02265 [Nitrospira sp.]|nr:hypothetical protein [Nitrospira sp.]
MSDEVHGDHDERNEGEGNAALLGAQQEKGFAGSRQREDCADSHHPPITCP